MDGAIVSYMITEMEAASYDHSIIQISLNTEIENQKEISISYTGSGIGYNKLILSNLEDCYVCNAIGEPVRSLPIPGRIEAENYFEMSGIQTEACTDIGGGLNVGYFDAGDWLNYYLEVN